MDAIESGNVRAVRVELDRGTDPSAIDSLQNEDVAPLCAAASEGRLEVTKLLLDRGADVKSCGDGWDPSPLFAAATSNQIKVMELLIKRGAIVNDSDFVQGFVDGGSYTLWRTALNGKLEAVKVLLAHGANPDTKTTEGEKLIDAAESAHQKGVIALLKKAGAK